MTPAVNCLKKARIKYKTHQYDHDPAAGAYGKEAAEKLNIPFERVFKTLVISMDKRSLSIAVVPVSRQLDLKKFARVSGSKKAALADKTAVERETGYILGGVSPIGQKKKLQTIIDCSALDFETVYVSAGRRGLQIEISPDDLSSQTGASFDKITR